MPTLQIPQDFSEFLRLLLAHNARFLVIGGYAVAFHGHPRFTGDLDIWVEMTETNAARIVKAIRGFGFDVPNLSTALFLRSEMITRMGEEPMRIEIFTTIPGVEFGSCFESRSTLELKDGLLVPVISLSDLKANKKASGRHKDLADLDELP